MNSGFYSARKHGSFLDYLEEDQELKPATSLPAIPQPQTPKEPMEFLSRSWSLSASEISKALAQKERQVFTDKQPNMCPADAVAPQLTRKIINSINSRKTGSIGKWFHHKELSSSTVKKKDKARMENAHMHSAISIAGLAAALAAVAAAGNSNDSVSKMSMALASATELLASHCIELAESAGADHDRVASVVRSAVDIQSPGDLMTLTAAAATALRGEAALKARLPKETRKNAAISPYDRGMAEIEEPVPCVGEVLQRTRKGVLRWKHISVYIKKSQVIIKIKSKHVGGAFSKKHKCVVYGVCDETTAWPYRKEKESSEEVYFGLKTAQGLLEFKCKSKIHKQRWVDGTQNLLHQVNSVEASERSLEFLSLSDSA
ncbi:VAN3-binding protein [Manihot esculenta]|uniref:PH domain-containing protein n=2 Tax=Manihot esculenta TaxID=3983 RepID=A0A251LFC0_MANES|nr:VAN3-binding protein [Manihot esculenta]XP_021598514.1 VAN3-binding protein [Manihot esculenta]XP_043810265.1 VAN3-binding protein [Manihot esculenta]KAG8659479.1 hypothetical protein MANES_02G040900v8 [Manihot esculenta]OAY56741.1 hypothetical protein MANES_02G040900v8 [Manihot esculenta]OAY56742.1 hypothetical protein MANES_02G040900v8 [Manihot esculenta]